MQELKYLVLGSSGHQFVDCVEWDIATLPNLVDYDVIIVNVRSLNGELLKKVSNQRFEQLRTFLTRFLYSDGSLIILPDFIEVDRRPTKYPDSVTNYDWCPVIIDLIKESGNTIQIIDNKFPKYFSKFKKWEFYFSLSLECFTNEFIRLIGRPPSAKYEMPQEILLQNRYGKMLSGVYTFEIFYRKKITHPYSSIADYGYGQEPDKIFGEIILLPLIQDLDYKEAIKLLLEDLLGKPQTSLPPAWVSKVKMPFIEGINSRIEDKLDEMKSIQKKIDTLENEKMEIESFKKLILSNGSELEEIFGKCLQDMGGEVTPRKYSEEEYILVYKGSECLVEAKGVSKSISLAHLRQLVDYLSYSTTSWTLNE